MSNSNRGIAEMRQVLYRIAMKKNSCTEMISCDFFEVAKLPPGLVAIRVCPDSDPVWHDEKPSRKGSENRIGWCRKSKGPGTTAVLSIAKRKIISRRRTLGSGLEVKPILYPDENQTVNQEQKAEDNLSSSPSLCLKELQESTPGWPLLGRSIREVSPENALKSKSEARELSVVEWVLSLPNRSTPSIMQSHKCMVHDEREMENEDFNHLKESMLGWPLLQKTASATPESILNQEMTVTQWAMSLPDRNIVPLTPLEKETNASEVDRNDTIAPSASAKLHKDLVDDLLKIDSSGCRWFSYEELKGATSHFSSENRIGEGGCSSVYKGSLPCGQAVAVKISKSYKEAWNNFSQEISITTLLNHRFIAPLIGICVEDSHLISVYNFLPKGSLEENLHGDSWENQVLPWEVRFKVAVVVAEALNYLHQECSPPVIHRDIKSSNILLSDDFQPQISDFGLAILGPRDSTEMLESDVVGTFGYIAPEYFMHGRVSDKIDVYSFGVVLLELLSGRRPIGSRNPKEEASLVKWAKPLLESGELKAVVDPKLDGKFDSVEMERVALAAACCVNEAPELRPKGSQVLRVLRGEESFINELKKTRKREEFLVEKLVSKPLPLLDAQEQRKRYTLQDYLRG